MDNSDENAPKFRWSKFFWKDWLSDQNLRFCSPAARGLWMDLLCLAHEGRPPGHLVINGVAIPIKRIAKIAGVTENTAQKLICELRESGVFSETNDGIIYSRRMVRDALASEIGRKNGALGGNPDLKNKGLGDNQSEPSGLTPGGVAGNKSGDILEEEAEKDKEANKEKESLSLSEAQRPAAPKKERISGIRLPDGWQPNDADKQFARDQHLDVRNVTGAFVDYYSGGTGAKEIRKDWPAAFRSWCRKAKQLGVSGDNIPRMHSF